MGDESLIARIDRLESQDALAGSAPKSWQLSRPVPKLEKLFGQAGTAP